MLTGSTDLKDIDTMSFDFSLGTPFHPYEQLMGVLPLASKDNIPSAYHVSMVIAVFNPYFDIILSQDLMYDPNSPIIDFYPVDFELDLNGKKQDWEAIVKIPFIDEKRLLKAMSCGC
jgi:5'-3' exoribonuclease 1